MSKYVRVNFDSEKRCDVYETDERMKGVYKHFVMMGLDECVDFVIDRKGCLTIHWDKKPTQAMKGCAEHIWNMYNETYVEHRFNTDSK